MLRFARIHDTLSSNNRVWPLILVHVLSITAVPLKDEEAARRPHVSSHRPSGRDARLPLPGVVVNTDGSKSSDATKTRVKFSVGVEIQSFSGKYFFDFMSVRTGPENFTLHSLCSGV